MALRSSYVKSDSTVSPITESVILHAYMSLPQPVMYVQFHRYSQEIRTQAITYPMMNTATYTGKIYNDTNSSYAR